MVAHMNAEALAQDLATGEAWYYSRSRKALWKKGETSGHVQRVVEMRVDCDQDALWLKVEQAGDGRLPHRAALLLLSRGSARPDGAVTLEFRNADKAFDPTSVYGGSSGKPQR